jgi:hypothetical protein
MMGLGCWLTIMGLLQGSGSLMIVASILGGRMLAPLVQIIAQWKMIVSAKDSYARLDALLEEMETIAASGTKLNLDYAIDEWLDEYDQEDILAYFKNCETSSLAIAQEELSENNYTWEQLKIMRIKFLSVVGN